jgi:hypothetical protein
LRLWRKIYQGKSPSLKVEHTGEDAQALLRQLMAIYDVKTLVAQLVAVGEQHWSPAILKRVATVARGRSYNPQEQALCTLLPQPPAHHPHYGFRFVDLFAGIGGIRTVLKRSAGSACLPASGINMRCAPIKPTGTAILSSIVSMKISAM